MPALLFLTRFLQRPFQIASVIPSSPMMVRRVAGKMDFSRPVVIAEYGAGEGCHSRELLRRAHPDSTLLLFELDPEFCRSLEEQFADDPRVSVINADCATLPQELAARGLAGCDYILSGIPFSILEIGKKREILRNTYQVLKPGGEFIIYQVTNELRRHATGDGLFPRATSEYFLQNVPPMFITVFHKEPAATNGARRNGTAASLNGKTYPVAASSSPGRNGNGHRAAHAASSPARR
ncbi:MAG: methyltransferase domain-containing protein [Verrucomicrobia bacterium]|nr:methyltransferase domain-containing protein [Verrucomicrobiota bacterium]